MKSTTIITSLLGAIALALPATAEQTAAAANTAVIQQVSQQINARPSTAGEVVKEAIIKTKASSELVLQIVKAAVIAAPEQAEDIRKVAVALAPDSEEEIQIVIASVLQGDQVAAENTDQVNAALDKKDDASIEPKGTEPQKNVVWLTNKGALQEGNRPTNQLPTKVQNTAVSQNQNHNTGGRTQGAGPNGGTVNVKKTTDNGTL